MVKNLTLYVGVIGTGSTGVQFSAKRGGYGSRLRSARVASIFTLRPQIRLMKNVSSIHKGGEQHWVGDGFPVRSVFGYQDLGSELTPFLLLDHAGPADFSATQQERGVGWHPHRGFETVSVAYQGAVDHQDSTGSHGSIGPGDVQWMTAGAGVLHKELHGRDFAARGGRFEMLQLWVNLPAQATMTARILTPS